MSKLDVDQGLIRELAGLLEDTGLSEIEIADKEKRLRVVRHQTTTVAAVAPAPAAVPVAAAPAAAAADAKVGEAEDFASHPGAVSSPMVGTAYLGPEPGAPAFVNVGDQVREGQTVLIIEAMKTFNEIPAPRSGTVSRLFVENGTPVEYGAVLLLIE